MSNPHTGSNFDDFLKEEGIQKEVEALAIKRVVSYQLQTLLQQKKVNKSQLARLMKTSRTSVDRMLDPQNPALTITTLGKMASALGCRLEIQFTPRQKKAPLH